MIAHVDAGTGASGDKLVCALMQAAEQVGAFDRERFVQLFAKLLPQARVQFEERSDQGIAGLGMKVTDANCARDHAHARSDGHEHTSWASIRSTIEGWREDGSIAQGAAERALRAFQIVAEAEAQVHGAPVDDVAFHEVGAIDSIADIVGASVLLDVLGIDTLHSSVVTLGYGTVKCAHGTLPVPAPATALICVGMPVQAGANEGELTTPTGAALLKANVAKWGPLPTMVPAAVGTGLGTRTIPGTPNALRIVVGAPASVVGDTSAACTNPEGMAIEGCVLLQTNIDHISPENAASCCEDLLDAGALDVWQQSIAMKKGRLGCILNVLCAPADADRLCELASKLTGSLGVRRSIVERSVAPRESRTAETSYGPVRFKLAWPDGSTANGIAPQHWIRPEHDDVARIAHQTGQSCTQVEDDLAAQWKQQSPNP